MGTYVVSHSIHVVSHSIQVVSHSMHVVSHSIHVVNSVTLPVILGGIEDVLVILKQMLQNYRNVHSPLIEECG